MEATQVVSPAEFLDSIFDTEKEQQALKAHLRERQLVSRLAALRVSKGVSQADLAGKMGCRQARVSKLEAGADAALTMADLEAYAKATDSEITLLVSDRGKSAAEQIKWHARCIHQLFLNLVSLSHKDDAIAEGVAKLHWEAFQNINRMLAESAEKLPPSPEDGKPYIRITPADQSVAKERENASEVAPKQKRVKPKAVGMR